MVLQKHIKCAKVYNVKWKNNLREKFLHIE